MTLLGQQTLGGSLALPPRTGPASALAREDWILVVCWSTEILRLSARGMICPIGRAVLQSSRFRLVARIIDQANGTHVILLAEFCAVCGPWLPSCLPRVPGIQSLTFDYKSRGSQPCSTTNNRFSPPLSLKVSVSRSLQLLVRSQKHSPFGS